MKYFLIFLFVLLNQCSLDHKSKYWNEDPNYNKNLEKKLVKILEKSNVTNEMSIKEYNIYIDDFTKKSKYPSLDNE